MPSYKTPKSNINQSLCHGKDFYDGISNSFTTTCHGFLNATFEYLSVADTFSISLHPQPHVIEYGIDEIQLEYGLCYDVVPLISRSLRYNASYQYYTTNELASIAKSYILGMIKCELDSYESSESYISIGTADTSDPRFII